MLTVSQQNELKQELSKFIACSLYPDDEDTLEEFGYDVKYLLRDLQERANKIFDKYFPKKPKSNEAELVKARAMEKLLGYANGEYRLTREDLEGYMQDAQLTEFDCNGLIFKVS